MNIPWLTPILGAISDGKIAASLERQVFDLTRERDDARVQLADAVAKIGVLEAQVDAMAPKKKIDAEALKVLKHLAEQGREISPNDLCGPLGIPIGRLMHHFGVLTKLKLIRCSRGRVSDREPPSRITTEGSSLLVEHGLL
jgi:hypothetical protein